MLNQKQVEELKQSLSTDAVRSRSNGSRAFSYIEGHFVINTANEIFGYEGWGYSLDKVEFKSIGEKGIVQAQITLHVKAGDDLVSRSDIGTSILTNESPQAYDTAIKGAVTDALKRAFRTFGSRFGNDLYDKDSPLHDVTGPAKNVSNEPKRLEIGQENPAQPPTAQPTPITGIVQCEACGRQIKSSAKYTIEKIVSLSRNKCDGHVLCYDHQQQYPQCLPNVMDKAA